MKKTLGLFALMTAMGGLTFAADPVVKVTGYVNSGIKATKVDTADFSVSSYANDVDAAGTWGKVGAMVTADNYGATATVKASDVAASAALDTAKVYWVPLAGLTVFGGTGYNDIFDGVDDKSKDFFWYTGVGAAFTAGGLSLGVNVNPNGAWTDLGLGAAFALPKVADLRATVQSNLGKLDEMTVTAKFTGVDKLTLSAGYISETMATTAKNYFDVAGSYGITDTLTAGVVFYDYLSGTSYFTVKPNASLVVVPGVTLSGYYQYTSEPSDSEVQGKVALAAGPGTLAAWTTYTMKPKTLVLAADYVISF